MKFKELRNKIGNQLILIKWNKSGIVEAAEVVSETGAVKITNVITNKSYHLPRKYSELDITILSMDERVSIGSLLPKNLRWIR